MQKKIKCEFCEGEIKHKVITARFNYLGNIIYVKDTPASVCTKCGEQYFDAPVYKHLEEIAKNRARIKRKISFPLAEYEKIFA